MVLEFYSNMFLHTSSAHAIRSEVRGREIEITIVDLFDCLGLPNEGLVPSFATVHEELVNENDREWSKLRALENFDVPEDATPRHQVTMYCKHFSIQARLLAYFLGHNVEPHSSDSHLVRVSDLYYMDKMVHGIEQDRRLPLASVILFCIKGVRKQSNRGRCPVFPVLLSKMFKHLKVNVKGAVVKKTTSVDVVDHKKMLTFGYTWNGHWYSNPNRLNRRLENIPYPADDEDDEEPEQGAETVEDQPLGDPIMGPTWQLPHGGRALPTVVFQRQMLDWAAQKERDHIELLEQVGGLREDVFEMQATLQTMLANQERILALHSQQPPPPPPST